jgi:hypothetical protein
MLWLILAVLVAGAILVGGKPGSLRAMLAQLRPPGERTLIVVALTFLSLISLRGGRLPMAAGFAFAAVAFGLYWQRTSGAGRPKSPMPGASAMTAEEAYRVLGLAQGASTEEIKQAHRRLMLRAHPDLGGSDYLASKLNEAKDVLLGR